MIAENETLQLMAGNGGWLRTHSELGSDNALNTNWVRQSNVIFSFSSIKITNIFGWGMTSFKIKLFTVLSEDNNERDKRKVY